VRDRVRVAIRHLHALDTLVYVTTASLGRAVSETVSSLDEIESFEAHITAEIAELETSQAALQSQIDNEFPAFAQLCDAHGRSRAVTLSGFLRRIRIEGRAALKAEGPASSFYRNVRDLQAQGLLD
jgi:hypothetical protein